jgi:hypothetical protein
MRLQDFAIKKKHVTMSPVRLKKTGVQIILAGLNESDLRRTTRD